MSISPPVCIGTYELGHSQCDGNPNSSNLIDRIHCAWRDRCVGLQAFCCEGGYNLSNVIGALGGTLVTLCETQIQKLGISHGQLSKAAAEERKPPQPVTAKKTSETVMEEIEQAKAAVKATIERARNPLSKRRRLRSNVVARTSIESITAPKPTQTAVEPINSHPDGSGTPRQEKPLKKDSGLITTHTLSTIFTTLLRDYFPNHAFGKPGRVIAKAGTFYSVNRVDEWKYIRWYCASSTGRDKAIATLRFKTRSGTLDVAVPATVEQLASVVDPAKISSLNAISTIDGQCRTLCRGLQEDGLELVTKALRDLCYKQVLDFTT